MFEKTCYRNQLRNDKSKCIGARVLEALAEISRFKTLLVKMTYAVYHFMFSGEDIAIMGDRSSKKSHWMTISRHINESRLDSLDTSGFIKFMESNQLVEFLRGAKTNNDNDVDAIKREFLFKYARLIATTRLQLNRASRTLLETNSNINLHLFYEMTTPSIVVYRLIELPLIRHTVEVSNFVADDERRSKGFGDVTWLDGKLNVTCIQDTHVITHSRKSTERNKQTDIRDTLICNNQYAIANANKAQPKLHICGELLKSQSFSGLHSSKADTNQNNNDALTKIYRNKSQNAMSECSAISTDAKFDNISHVGMENEYHRYAIPYDTLYSESDHADTDLEELDTSARSQKLSKRVSFTSSARAYQQYGSCQRRLSGDIHRAHDSKGNAIQNYTNDGQSATEQKTTVANNSMRILDPNDSYSKVSDITFPISTESVGNRKFKVIERKESPPVEKVIISGEVRRHSKPHVLNSTGNTAINLKKTIENSAFKQMRSDETMTECAKFRSNHHAKLVSKSMQTDESVVERNAFSLKSGNDNLQSINRIQHNQARINNEALDRQYLFKTSAKTKDQDTGVWIGKRNETASKNKSVISASVNAQRMRKQNNVRRHKLDDKSKTLSKSRRYNIQKHEDIVRLVSAIFNGRNACFSSEENPLCDDEWCEFVEDIKFVPKLILNQKPKSHEMSARYHNSPLIPRQCHATEGTSYRDAQEGYTNSLPTQLHDNMTQQNQTVDNQRIRRTRDLKKDELKKYVTTVWKSGENPTREEFNTLKYIATGDLSFDSEIHSYYLHLKKKYGKYLEDPTRISNKNTFTDSQKKRIARSVGDRIIKQLAARSEGKRKCSKSVTQVCSKWTQTLGEEFATKLEHAQLSQTMSHVFNSAVDIIESFGPHRMTVTQLADYLKPVVSYNEVLTASEGDSASQIEVTEGGDTDAVDEKWENSMRMRQSINRRRRCNLINESLAKDRGINARPSRKPRKRGGMSLHSDIFNTENLSHNWLSDITDRSIGINISQNATARSPHQLFGGTHGESLNLGKQHSQFDNSRNTHCDKDAKLPLSTNTMEMPGKIQSTICNINKSIALPLQNDNQTRPVSDGKTSDCVQHTMTNIVNNKEREQHNINHSHVCSSNESTKSDVKESTNSNTKHCKSHSYAESSAFDKEEKSNSIAPKKSTKSGSQTEKDTALCLNSKKKMFDKIRSTSSREKNGQTASKSVDNLQYVVSRRTLTDMNSVMVGENLKKTYCRDEEKVNQQIKDGEDVGNEQVSKNVSQRRSAARKESENNDSSSRNNAKTSQSAPLDTLPNWTGSAVRNHKARVKRSDSREKTNQSNVSRTSIRNEESIVEASTKRSEAIQSDISNKGNENEVSENTGKKHTRRSSNLERSRSETINRENENQTRLVNRLVNKKGNARSLEQIHDRKEPTTERRYLIKRQLRLMHHPSDTSIEDFSHTSTAVRNRKKYRKKKNTWPKFEKIVQIVNRASKIRNGIGAQFMRQQLPNIPTEVWRLPATEQKNRKSSMSSHTIGKLPQYSNSSQVLCDGDRSTYKGISSQKTVCTDPLPDSRVINKDGTFQECRTSAQKHGNGPCGHDLTSTKEISQSKNPLNKRPTKSNSTLFGEEGTKSKTQIPKSTLMDSAASHTCDPWSEIAIKDKMKLVRTIRSNLKRYHVVDNKASNLINMQNCRVFERLAAKTKTNRLSYHKRDPSKEEYATCYTFGSIDKNRHQISDTRKSTYPHCIKRNDSKASVASKDSIHNFKDMILATDCKYLFSNDHTRKIVDANGTDLRWCDLKHLQQLYKSSLKNHSLGSLANYETERSMLSADRLIKCSNKAKISEPIYEQNVDVLMSSASSSESVDSQVARKNKLHSITRPSHPLILRNASTQTAKESGERKPIRANVDHECSLCEDAIKTYRRSMAHVKWRRNDHPVADERPSRQTMLKQDNNYIPSRFCDINMTTANNWNPNYRRPQTIQGNASELDKNYLTRFTFEDNVNHDMGSNPYNASAAHNTCLKNVYYEATNIPINNCLPPDDRPAEHAMSRYENSVLLYGRGADLNTMTHYQPKTPLQTNADIFTNNKMQGITNPIGSYRRVTNLCARDDYLRNPENQRRFYPLDTYVQCQPRYKYENTNQNAGNEPERDTDETSDNQNVNMHKQCMSYVCTQNCTPRPSVTQYKQDHLHEVPICCGMTGEQASTAVYQDDSGIRSVSQRGKHVAISDRVTEIPQQSTCYASETTTHMSPNSSCQYFVNSKAPITRPYSPGCGKVEHDACPMCCQEKLTGGLCARQIKRVDSATVVTSQSQVGQHETLCCACSAKDIGVTPLECKQGRLNSRGFSYTTGKGISCGGVDINVVKSASLVKHASGTPNGPCNCSTVSSQTVCVSVSSNNLDKEIANLNCRRQKLMDEIEAYNRDRELVVVAANRRARRASVSDMVRYYESGVKRPCRENAISQQSVSHQDFVTTDACNSTTVYKPVVHQKVVAATRGPAIYSQSYGVTKPILSNCIYTHPQTTTFSSSNSATKINTPNVSYTGHNTVVGVSSQTVCPTNGGCQNGLGNKYDYDALVSINRMQQQLPHLSAICPSSVNPRYKEGCLVDTHAKYNMCGAGSSLAQQDIQSNTHQATTCSVGCSACGTRYIYKSCNNSADNGLLYLCQRDNHKTLARNTQYCCECSSNSCTACSEIRGRHFHEKSTNKNYPQAPVAHPIIPTQTRDDVRETGVVACLKCQHGCLPCNKPTEEISTANVTGQAEKETVIYDIVR